MKNTNISKLIAVFASIALMAGYAMPASADMTTAGYYDQFGVFRVYQTYSGPTDNYYGNYGNNANSYYPNSSSYGRPVSYNTYTIRPVTCAPGETYQAANNFCLPPARDNLIVISGDGYEKPSTKKTTTTTKSDTTTTTTNTDNETGQASAISSIFGGKKKASDKLEITNILVTSGPKNIYENKDDVNCEVLVSWATTVPAAGQVVYGPLSQPNAETFSYPSTAPEGNSYLTKHEVKLGCLENIAYSLRIVQNSGGANPQRVVSDEQTIFPIKIRTQIPSVTPTGEAAISTNGASAVSTIGSILTNPFILIIILGAIGYVVFRAFMAKKSEDGGHSAPAHAAEPALQIPHH